MNTVSAYNIRSLIHVYDGKTALDIQHLDIPSGQIYGIVGPNGSGKTTLLSILSLLLTPFSGSVLMYGVEATQVKNRQRLRRNVTLVHQKPILFSTTVKNNICYGLRAIGLPAKEIKIRVRAMLEELKLLGLADKQARKLSGGEAQRVVLARGLVLESPIILLDEPTNSLDDAFRPLLLKLLRQANQIRKTTIIVAAHDLNFVSSLTDQVIRLEKGRISGSKQGGEYKLNQ